MERTSDQKEPESYVPKAGHASVVGVGGEANTRNGKGHDKPFLYRGGDLRQRRLGEIRLTVRYVCLRRCLSVLISGCR